MSREIERLQQQEPEVVALKERLQTLIDKKVASFEVDSSGSEVSIKFDDGTELSFHAWDAHYDQPNPEEIRVTSPKESQE